MAIVDIKHTQTIEEMLRDGGSGGGITPIPVTFNSETGIHTIQKTWQELYDANQTQILFLGTMNNFAVIPLGGVFIDPITEKPTVGFFMEGSSYGAYCDSADDYPQWQED